MVDKDIKAAERRWKGARDKEIQNWMDKHRIDKAAYIELLKIQNKYK